MMQSLKRVKMSTDDAADAPVGMHNQFNRACEIGDLPFAKRVWDEGRMWEGTSSAYSYALGLASANGHYNIVHWLLRRGVSKVDYAFEEACSEGHLAIAKLLQKHGAKNVNEALHEACFNGHVHVAEWLIKDMGAYDFVRPLKLACWNRSRDDIAFLLFEYGARPSFSDVDAIECFQAWKKEDDDILYKI